MKGDTIPNGEFLYKYVKPESFPEGQTEIPFGIFEIKEMSCDWAKYQKMPEKSFHIKEGKNLIIRITVCDEIKFPCNPERPTQKQPQWEQKVIHDPIAKGEDLSHPTIANLSHSLIQGAKRIHITKAIARNSTIYKLVSEQSHKSVNFDWSEQKLLSMRFDILALTTICMLIVLCILLT